MKDSIQYTTRNKSGGVSLTLVAKQKMIPRKLLSELLLENKIIENRVFVNREYGYTFLHRHKTSVYFYKDKIEYIFKVLKIPKIEKYQKICFTCRRVKGIMAFRKRMAVCIECKRRNK